MPVAPHSSLILTLTNLFQIMPNTLQGANLSPVENHCFEVMLRPSFRLYCSLVLKLLKMRFFGFSLNFVVWTHQTQNGIFTAITPLQGLMYTDVQICANKRKIIPVGWLQKVSILGGLIIKSVPCNLLIRLNCQNPLLHRSATYHPKPNNHHPSSDYSVIFINGAHSLIFIPLRFTSTWQPG